jgi:hypothetical protein
MMKVRSVYAHWFEVLKEVGMKPIMDRNIPLTIIRSIALTVPPILYYTGNGIISSSSEEVRNCMCLLNGTLDLQIVSAQK